VANPETEKAVAPRLQISIQGDRMKSIDQVYYKLQKHLNNQAVGFPATKSGAEIRILKHVFTPNEAELVLYLSFRFQSVEKIFSKARKVIESKQALERVLQCILKKGGIEVKSENGISYYRCIPLIVGMYELQHNRLTPEFIQDFNDYVSDRAFGVEFISTKLPQMRTIPIKKSIEPTHTISTYDEIFSLLEDSKGPFAILECTCRKKKSMEGKVCKVTDRKETCLCIGEMSHVLSDMNAGRIISKEEAISILEENQNEGLVLQPSNTRDVDFICSCCGCCCGILRMQKRLPKPIHYWTSNFYATIETSTCKGCGICEAKCHVNAIRTLKKHEHAIIDLDRCIGCGICVSICPTTSIALEKKQNETAPPQNREELLDIIKKNKKGKLGKMMVTGRFVFDAIRTGQSHLLK
jgi:ferredoxin